ncbi:NADH-quinone oxidoreductase domain-containing protein [Desulfonema magnum]|uniref:NADH-quinone oxidoreductase domain-containing protein n=2 Tax=Desulfonema magnum TaxID=45655 RepID=A0A975BWS7_9BACT|nr:NADH-quinone oxidoreductase domain-containing protein [Desulfonema magnum]
MGFPPGLIFIIGALFIPLLKGKIKSAFMLLLPLVAFVILVSVPDGSHWTFRLLNYDLVLGQVDRLSRVFGYIFILISFIAIIFALKAEDDLQHVAGFIYAGSALGVTFAGDLFSLYIFWEIMAVASTFLILARRTVASQAAAFRYILVHIVGGLFLLAGIILYIHNSGSLTFGFIGLSSMGSWLIFIGIAVNAAIPPLHPWLKDAYPEATATGAVFLSAFTTKSAVYVMARTFPGTELLIWLGAFMTIIPVFYAEIENDIRRVLGYSLVNQVGFMMCGVGIGTQLAINGTVSHAFCHILYKALLFMAAGSVLHVTGKIKCTQIGGLYKTMPLTCLFCLIGAASISAFPLFSGFVSKSMIISAAGHHHLVAVWLMLQFASAGVIAHAGIKVPYFTFFGHDSGIRAKEPPLNMLIAMGMAAFLCVFLGVYPQPLYDILPYPVEYVPYTGAHVVGQLQLLMFGILAFYLLLRSGYYPAEIRAINLDTDWFYRKGARHFFNLTDKGFNGINRFCDKVLARNLSASLGRFSKNAPARLTLLFIIPACFLTGKKENERAVLKKNVYAAFETASTSLGISAAAAMLFIVMLVLIK